MRALRSVVSEYFAEVASAQADVLLTLVYWSAVACTVAVLRLTGRRLLEPGPSRGWLARRPASGHDDLRRQY